MIKEMDMIPNYEAMDFGKRVAFQRILIPKMIPDYKLKSEEEQHRLAFEWADPETNDYARKVSRIIDNTDNERIRELIMSEQYTEACELIIPMLIKEDEHAYAA